MDREQATLNALRKDPTKPDRTAPTVIVHAKAPKRRAQPSRHPTIVVSAKNHAERLAAVARGLKETCGEQTGGAVFKLLEMYLDKPVNRAAMMNLVELWEGFK